MKAKVLLLTLGVSTMLVACGGTAIMPAGNDTYIVTSESSWSGTTGSSQIKDAVVKANEFCAKKGGLVAKLMNTTLSNGLYGYSVGSATIEFTCVPPSK